MYTILPLALLTLILVMTLFPRESYENQTGGVSRPRWHFDFHFGLYRLDVLTKNCWKYADAQVDQEGSVAGSFEAEANLTVRLNGWCLSLFPSQLVHALLLGLYGFCQPRWFHGRSAVRCGPFKESQHHVALVARDHEEEGEG